MEEYVKLEEEKARKRGKVFNWETTKYGKIWYDEDVHDLRSVETEFLAIFFNDKLTSEEVLSCEPTVSSLNNNEIDFRISFDESDDEDYTVKMDDPNITMEEYIRLQEENLVGMVRCITRKLLRMVRSGINKNSQLTSDLIENEFSAISLMTHFENEFPAIVYNNAQTSKSNLLTEPILNPQHIDEFNLKDGTSLSECDEEEQNVLNFNDLFPFNVIYPNDSKSDKNNDDDNVDIEHSLGIYLSNHYLM
ncbi:hypothetical protein Tco_1185444 [Tanacetum coccineum]